MSILWQLNYGLFQVINGNAGQVSWLDALMIFCANTLIFFWPLFLLIVWGLPVSWRSSALQPGEAEILQERRAAVLWIAIACIIAYAINLLIEQFVFEPRPFVTHKVHLLFSHVADASFPSDHTAWSFAVLGVLLFCFFPLFRKRQSPSEQGAAEKQSNGGLFRKLVAFILVAFVIGCIIGFARIFVGVHYPDDILGGAIDGLLAGFIVTVLRRWLSRPTDAVIGFFRKMRLA
jgi:undecaprenyl-diphosphatase